MSVTNALEIVALAALLLASGLFSGSETALFSLDRLRARTISATHPRQGKAIERLIGNPRRLLISILIGNMFVNVLASALADSLSTRFVGPPYDQLASIIGMSCLVLVVGEITPKSIAVRMPERIATFVAPVIEWEAKIVFPMRFILRRVSDMILSLFVRGGRKTSLTEEEFLTAVRIGQVEGVLDSDELRMIESVVELGSASVADIMRPRSEIVAVAVTASRDEIAMFFSEKKVSRILVYEESIDDAFGVLHVRDFLKQEKTSWDGKTLRRLVRPPHFVPETATARRVFWEFRRKRLHLGVVVDEYGGVSGLVTMEDILAEIVGEIVKMGTDVPKMRRIDKRSALVQGSLDLDDLNEAMDLNFEDDESVTVAGFIINKLGRIPVVGETIEIGGVRFHVTRAKPNRVDQMIVAVGPREEREGVLR